MTKSDARNLQQRYGEVVSREKNRLHHRGAAAIIEERPAPLALFCLPNLNLLPCLARSEPSLRDRCYIAEVAVVGVSPATNIVVGAFSEFWSSCKHDLCRGAKKFLYRSYMAGVVEGCLTEILMLRLRYQLVWRLLQQSTEAALTLTLEVKDNDPTHYVNKKPPATRGATGGFYSNS